MKYTLRKSISLKKALEFILKRNKLRSDEISDFYLVNLEVL